MLDPITAIGLVASVVQLVQSGHTFIAKCKVLYKSGSSDENLDIATITCDLENVSLGLVESLEATTRQYRPPAAGSRPANLQPSEKTDQALLKLARQCQVLSEELVNKLNRLNQACKRKKWKSFRQALKNTWAQDDLDAIATKLYLYRDELQFNLVVSLRERAQHLHIEQEQRYRQLNTEGQETIRRLLDTKCEVFGQSLQSQTYTFNQRHDVSDDLTRQGLQEQNRQHRFAESRASARHDDIKQLLHEHEILADRRKEEVLAAINKKRSKTEARSTERAVLDHLIFPRMSERQAEVSEQYRKTFEWVFADRSERERQWPSLVEWLEKGDGCYWLYGKPGSGKSTLMKFIFDDLRTTSALRQWAPRTRSLLGLEPWAPKNGIISASFFFWNAGSYMQKSQVGLLRTLLHDLLFQCPAIIPVVLPQLYEAYTEGRKMADLSLGQLKRAFKKLVESSGSQFGICVFVDGLDEYIADQGTHTELAEFFLSLCTAPKMKAILSARPLVAFEHVLGECPKIRLQDLTVADIDFYARDRISKHNQVIHLAEENPRVVSELIKEITAKAEGVFLWVKLAVNTLLEGLQSYDSVDDLKSRLAELPGEIDDLYMCMLERIAPRYRVEASEMLQLLTTFRRLGLGTLTTLDMSFAMEKDSDFAYNSRIRVISEEEVIRRGQRLELRLAAICPGFFEIHRKVVTSKKDPKQARRELAIHTRNFEDWRAPTAPDIIYVREYDSWKGAEVEFLHKTAADFLHQDHIQAYLIKITSEEDFHPLKRLLQSRVLIAKSFPCKYVLNLPFNEMGKVLSEAMFYAWHLEQQTNRIQVGLLDELEQTLEYQRKLWDSMPDPQISYFPRIAEKEPFGRHESFVGMAGRYGLHHYVKYRISEQRLLNSKTQTLPLLFSLLTVSSKENSSPPSKNLVKLLLGVGADPNAYWHGLTAWAYACIIFCGLWCKPVDGVDRRDYADIMAAMIMAGADPNVLIRHDDIRVLSPMSMISQRLRQNFTSRREKLRFKERKYRDLNTAGAYYNNSESEYSDNTSNRPGYLEDREREDCEVRLLGLLKRRGGWVYCKGPPLEDNCFWEQDGHRNTAWARWQLFTNDAQNMTLPKVNKAVWQRRNEDPCIITWGLKPEL